MPLKIINIFLILFSFKSSVIGKNSYDIFDKANIFIDWLISPETMNLISSYKLKNQQLFFPIN